MAREIVEDLTIYCTINTKLEPGRGIYNSVVAPEMMQKKDDYVIGPGRYLTLIVAHLGETFTDSGACDV